MELPNPDDRMRLPPPPGKFPENRNASKKHHYERFSGNKHTYSDFDEDVIDAEYVVIDRDAPKLDAPFLNDDAPSEKDIFGDGTLNSEPPSLNAIEHKDDFLSTYESIEPTQEFDEFAVNNPTEPESSSQAENTARALEDEIKKRKENPEGYDIQTTTSWLGMMGIKLAESQRLRSERAIINDADKMSDRRLKNSQLSNHFENSLNNQVQCAKSIRSDLNRIASGDLDKPQVLRAAERINSNMEAIQASNNNFQRNKSIVPPDIMKKQNDFMKKYANTKKNGMMHSIKNLSAKLKDLKGGAKLAKQLQKSLKNALSSVKALVEMVQNAFSPSKPKL